MNSMKPLKARKKEDLIELFIDLNLDLPAEPYTKDKLILELESNGVTNRSLRALEDKKEKDAEATSLSYNGMAVVCMDRENASFKYKSFEFTQAKRYVLMPDDDAKGLMASFPGFRKATREELTSYYK